MKKTTAMKTVSVWPGAVVKVGEEIEIRVLTTREGLLKLAIAAPPEYRIARQEGSRPPRGRRLRRWGPRAAKQADDKEQVKKS